jgi:RNase P subunit RPR2
MKLVTKKTRKDHLINEWLIDRRFKGVRYRVIYLVREYFDLKRGRRIEKEIVKGSARIGKLERELGEPLSQTFTDRPGSSMNAMLAALASAIYYDRDESCPSGMDADDWVFNLARARQLLKENGVDRWDMCEIAKAILPPRLKIKGRIKRICCDWCRFPILFGYRVNGRLVERKRKLPVHFCEKACLMNRRRRLPSTPRETWRA